MPAPSVVVTLWSDSDLIFPSERQKPEYWHAYPKDAVAFAARVQEGIHYTHILRQPSLRPPKPTYHGIHRSAVGRDLVFWLADQVRFAQEHDNIVMRAIEAFVHDRQDALTEWRQKIEMADRAFEEALIMPTPPIGFRWVARRRKWMPGEYRLEVERPEPDPHAR